MTDSPRETPESAADPTTARARPAFFVAMLLIPFLILGAAEGVLRLAGFGDSYPMWVAADESGEWLRMNPRVSERWFFGDVTAPGATYDPFRAERRPETLRIVVMGGSTALGFPYFYGGAFPRMLEDRLRRAYPDRDVEVVNTALTAVNSHTLRDIANEVLELEPDAVLIYAGHNEYYGALGVASTLSRGSVLAVRAWLATRELRLVQAIAAARDAFASGAGDAGRTDAPGGTTMARMVGEQRIPLGSGLHAAGAAQLRDNLGAVLKIYASAGVPVYLGTLVSNERDHPPFIAGDPGPEVDWPAIEAAAAAAIGSGDVSELRAEVADLPARDSTYAAGFYALGQVFESLGDTVTAGVMYRAARDRDPLRFRAPTEFNALLRELAGASGATIVEVEEAFRAASPGGIIGNSLLTEHLHPNLDGYHLMQEVFHDALAASGVIGVPSGPVEYPRSAIPATPVDSIYAAYLIGSLTSGWPFQTDPEEEDRRMRALFDRIPVTPDEELGRALFLRQIGWVEAQSRLLAWYGSEGRWAEALRPARALALEEALEYIPKARVGSIELRLGNREAAERWFESAAALAPASDPLAGAILRSIRSLDALEAAVSAGPTSENRYDLAAALALLDQPDQAIEVLDALLADDPDNERALSLRETIRRSSR